MRELILFLLRIKRIFLGAITIVSKRKAFVIFKHNTLCWNLNCMRTNTWGLPTTANKCISIKTSAVCIVTNGVCFKNQDIFNKKIAVMPQHI